MVHLLPLPGSPRSDGSMAAVVDRAVADATALERGGLDGVLVENFLDAPFHPGAVPPETVAGMSVALAAVIAAVRVPVGVNVLRNDARGALAVAAATGARFIRVNVHTGTMWTDQGVIEGRAHETLRARRALGVDVRILADVEVKHATPPPGYDLEDAARDAWTRGLADALLVTGPATGAPADPAVCRRVRSAAPDAPVWLASGVTPTTVAAALEAADGVIVGSALCSGGVAGAGVDPGRVDELAAAARRAT